MAMQTEKKVKNLTRYVSDPTKNILFRVDNVRCSYPHVDAPWAQKPTDTPAYSVQGLLDKDTHGEAITEINAAIDEMISEQQKTKRNFAVKGSKRALKDGDDPEYAKAETAGCWILSTREPTNPPTLKARIDGRVQNITPEQAKKMIYGGCYVSILFRLWPQDNEYGKGINGGLNGIVFLRDGEAFGEGRVDDSDAYDDLGDDDGGFDDDDLDL